VTALNSHHRREGATGSLPVGRVLISEVFDAAHVSGETFTDEYSSVETKGVAVLGIEVRR